MLKQLALAHGNQDIEPPKTYWLFLGAPFCELGYLAATFIAYPKELRTKSPSFGENWMFLERALAELG